MSDAIERKKARQKAKAEIEVAKLANPHFAKCNPMQRRFVEEYVVDLNAKAAYVRAGYKSAAPGPNASRLVARPHISNAIDYELKLLRERSFVRADRVLVELARVAFGDIRDIYDENGNLRPIKDLDPEVSAAIASIKIVAQKENEDGSYSPVLEIKRHDKIQALTLLCKHLGIAGDNLKVSGDGTNPLTLLLQQVQGSALKPNPNPGSKQSEESK
jgi:phage terminase small subunit